MRELQRQWQNSGGKTYENNAGQGRENSPTRAHSTDAGLDLYARDTQVVPAKESAVFDTGVHVELPEGTAGFLKSKSGLNTKHGITSEGVIDVGYTGSIVAKWHNHSGLDYKVNAGDKITQLVIVPILAPELGTG